MTQQTDTQTQPETVQPEVKKPRGFAAMSAERRAEISRKGGQAAHQTGKAHRFTQDEAREAGRKGGQATHQRKTAST